MDADRLSLVLSVCSLHTDEVGVGTLVKASAHRQQFLIRLTQHLQQLSKQREKRRNLIKQRALTAANSSSVWNLPGFHVMLSGTLKSPSLYQAETFNYPGYK